MYSLFVFTVTCLAAYASAAPSGWGVPGAVLAGPAGIVTSAGAIGPVGALGLGGVLAAPGAVVAGPALGLGLGLGAITNGGGAIGLSGAGVAVQGPPTAPAVISGPSGRIVANGLWGPTANVGLGSWGGAWNGAGAWGKGW